MTVPDSEPPFASASCLPLPPEQELEIITELLRAADADLKEGDVFCVLPERWWMDWNEYVGVDRKTEHFTFSANQIPLHSASRPGKIDNSALIFDGTNEDGNSPTLRKDLQEQVDYRFVPIQVWKKFLKWYGGGPELPRKLIKASSHLKNFIVEVHPLCLHLFNACGDSQHIITISRKASVGELYNTICTVLKLEQSEIHIWDFYRKKRYNILENFDQTLEDAQLHMDHEILLEQKVDGHWPSSSGMDSTGNELALVSVEPSTSDDSIAGAPYMSNGGHSTRFGADFAQGKSPISEQWDADYGGDFLSNGTNVNGRGGLTGLHNLGNTCFMNSAIQCLVHTPPLADFFLHDYTEEINKDNPLGMHGELAKAFGDLLRKLWLSGHTPVAPRAFKAKLGHFAPQFSGYNQHDSQELLAFLLDGLHEDLNRVKNKPYIEVRDAGGRSDQEFADECWQNHKARNDSIIVDVCQGQYKSTLICPDCKKVSVTFDPFMYLSLPLPLTLTRNMTVTVISGQGSHLPMSYTVTVQKNGCCKDLTQSLSIESCLNNSEALLLAEVYDHKIYRYLEDPFESLSNIKDEEHIVAYRLPNNHEKLLRLEIMHRRSERYIMEPQHNDHPVLFGTPLVTCLAMDCKSEPDTEAAVGKILAPLLWENVCPSHPKANNNNYVGQSLDGIVPTDRTCSCEAASTSNVEPEDTSIGHPLFQLALADDNVVSRYNFDCEPKHISGSRMRVFMNWSDREFQLYNSSLLEDLPKVFKPGFIPMKTRQEAPSLFSCFEAFLKEEPLGPDDMWYCPSCKEHKPAIKKLDLWRLPEILVVHLKRFSYSRFQKDKLDIFVNYPLHNLDLSQYVKQSSTPNSHVYELYAVSNHYGGLGGGHYSAYAKLIDEERWYHFDDSYVSSVSEDKIKTSAGYVLFYQRKEADSRMAGDEPSNCSDPPSC